MPVMRRSVSFAGEDEIVLLPRWRPASPKPLSPAQAPRSRSGSEEISDLESAERDFMGPFEKLPTGLLPSKAPIVLSTGPFLRKFSRDAPTDSPASSKDTPRCRGPLAASAESPTNNRSRNRSGQVRAEIEASDEGLAAR